LSELWFLRRSAIRTLWVEWSPFLRSLAGIGHLPLSALHLENCISLASLDELRKTRLTKLDISWCDSRLDISGVSALPLETLICTGNFEDKYMPTVALLGATLTRLDLDVSNITDAGLALLGKSGVRLRTLSLAHCNKITAGGIAHLVDMPLETLNLHDTPVRIEDCPPRLWHCITVEFTIKSPMYSCLLYVQRPSSSLCAGWN
jgi:hypothetical protein